MAKKEKYQPQIFPIAIPVINSLQQTEQITIEGKEETDYFIGFPEGRYDKKLNEYVLFNPKIIVAPKQPLVDTTNLSDLALISVVLNKNLVNLLIAYGVINIPVLLAEDAVLEPMEEDDNYFFLTRTALQKVLLAWETEQVDVLNTLASYKDHQIIFLASLIDDLFSTYDFVEGKAIFGLRVNNKDKPYLKDVVMALNKRCEKLTEFFVKFLQSIPAELRYRGAIAHEKSHQVFFSRGSFYDILLLLFDEESPRTEKINKQLKVFEEVGTARQEILSGNTPAEQYQLLVLRLSHLMSYFRMYVDDQFKKSLFQKEIEKIYDKRDKTTLDSPYILAALILLFPDVFLDSYGTRNEKNLTGILSLEPLLDRSLTKDEAVIELMRKIVLAIDTAIKNPEPLLSTLRDPIFQQWIEWHFQAKLGEMVTHFNKKGLFF